MKLKAKDSTGVELVCEDCNRKRTINECTLHKSNMECYYCHLVKEHLHEDKEEMKQNG